MSGLKKMPYANARFTITQSFEFDASHNLERKDVEYLDVDAGNIRGELCLTMEKCFYNHGHTYKINVEWEGYPTFEKPLVYPFAILKSFAKTLVRCVDHKNLNEVFPWPTTLENLTNWFFVMLDQHSDERIRLYSVEIFEGSCNRIKVTAK